MKKIILIIMVLLASSLFSLMPISKDEVSGITWLSETTKLSKDIYHEVHRIWSLDIFKSIEYLEGVDLNEINKLMDKYKIKYQLQNDTIGTYDSPYISNLFMDFSEKYDDSEFEALRITATLEELVISDINDMFLYTTNSDVKDILTKIRYSSISQIRAINNYMRKKYKTEYQAQFLTREQLKAILLN